MEGRNIITKHDDIEYALKHQIESDLNMHGQWNLEHRRNGKVLWSGDQGGNTFTTEGMARILNVIFFAAATSATIYCGLFKNNVTPALADTALAKLGSGSTYGECQDADYDSPLTNRATYTVVETATAVCTNAASKCEFVMDASITLYGGFLGTAAAKTATTGTLLCAKKFGTARDVVADDEISVGVVITLSTS